MSESKLQYWRSERMWKVKLWKGKILSISIDSPTSEEELKDMFKKDKES